MNFDGSKRTAIDSPFGAVKKVIGGYSIIQARSKEAAIAWAKRSPFGTEVHRNQEVVVEIRPIWEPEDIRIERRRSYPLTLTVSVAPAASVETPSLPGPKRASAERALCRFRRDRSRPEAAPRADASGCGRQPV